MTFRTGRRRALRLGAAGATALLAGCTDSLPGGEDGGDDEDEDDEETETEEPLAVFRRWIPASFVEGRPDVEVGAFDTNRAADEFPAAANADLSIEDLATSLGVDERDIEWLVTLRDEGSTEAVTVTGTFDVDAVLDEIGSEQTTPEQGPAGYQVVRDQVAVGPSAIVIGQLYEDIIAAAEGEADYLGATDEGWDRTLSEVADGTFIGAGRGWVIDNPAELNPERMGFKIDAGSGSRVQVTAYLYYESESTAQEELETARDQRDILLGEEGEVETLERSGNRITIAGTEPASDF